MEPILNYCDNMSLALDPILGQVNPATSSHPTYLRLILLLSSYLQVCLIWVSSLHLCQCLCLSAHSKLQLFCIELNSWSSCCKYKSACK